MRNPFSGLAILIAIVAAIAIETKETFFIVLSSRIIPSGFPLCIRGFLDQCPT